MGTETILKYKDRLKALSAYLGCDWTLLAGQLMQESSGDPGAIGDNGLAYGLSQIHRATLDNHHPDWPMESMLDLDKHMEVYEAEMKRLYDWLDSKYSMREASQYWPIFVAWNWGARRLRDWIDWWINHVEWTEYFWSSAYMSLPPKPAYYMDMCYEKANLFQENA